MTIHYSNGKALEAVLLSRTDTTLRAAVEGAEDVMLFSNINGAWVSEDCEPVQIVFEWQRGNFKIDPAAEDCVCSQELAARLLRLLFSGEPSTPAGVDPAAEPAATELLTARTFHQ